MRVAAIPPSGPAPAFRLDWKVRAIAFRSDPGSTG
jgi:hypothetical protein